MKHSTDPPRVRVKSAYHGHGRCVRPTGVGPSRNTALLLGSNAFQLEWRQAMACS